MQVADPPVEFGGGNRRGLGEQMRTGEDTGCSGDLEDPLGCLVERQDEETQLGPDDPVEDQERVRSPARLDPPDQLDQERLGVEELGEPDAKGRPRVAPSRSRSSIVTCG